jgi:ubiquinone/menaquinone biosynthesis C-methylase UbiE
LRQKEIELAAQQRSEGAERGAFHEFERAGWSRPDVVTVYQSAFGRLTTKTVPALLDAAGAGPGVRVLDVATGPGFAAAAAAERGASVTGIDFSSSMIAEARRNFPGLDFREGDALALDFPDESFDAVVINYGILHFEQPERAIAEAFRVLKPGGLAAFTVWCEPHRAVAFGIVLDAVKAHGDLSVTMPAGPYFFRFSSHDEFRDAFIHAGFEAPKVVEVAQDWSFQRPEELMEAFAAGTVRTGGLLERQSAAQLARIRESVLEAASAYAQPDGSLRVPMPAVLASGTKPRNS